MLTNLRPAVTLLALFTALTGLAYPLAITGLAQLAWPAAANGSLIPRDGRPIGSALIGQNFTGEKYFHGRPSATQAADPQDATKTVDAPYNGANSAGSNLGPTSQKLLERIKSSAAFAAPIPADAVTTSASGLDPHISPANAAAQIARVARARGTSEDRIRALVDAAVEGRLLGLIGEPRVNVLMLNLALDSAKLDSVGAK